MEWWADGKAAKGGSWQISMFVVLSCFCPSDMKDLIALSLNRDLLSIESSRINLFAKNSVALRGVSVRRVYLSVAIHGSVRRTFAKSNIG